MNGSPSALLLRDFVNTYDIDADVDEFGAPADLGAWLVDHGLVPAGAHPEESDLVIAVSLREELRAAISDGGHPAGDVLAELTLRVALGPAEAAPAGEAPAVAAPGGGAQGGAGTAQDGGWPRLVPVGQGVKAGLAGIAAAIIVSRTDGDWARLKVCQERSCQWAFFDTSKNRSRSWCSMRLCGNRTKTRAYRARQRGADG